MGGGEKTRITCYGCQASYLVDLAKTPPELTRFNCLECGGDIPILARVLAARSPVSAPTVPSAPVAAPVAQEGEEPDQLLDRDRGLAFSTGAGPAWLTICGGAISLLLAVFVLLWASSAGERRQFEIVVGAVSRALGGHISFPAGGPPGPEAAASAAPDPLVRPQAGGSQESQGLVQLRERLRVLVERDQMQKAVTVRDEPKGVTIIVQDMALFDSGSAEISPGMRPLLLRLGRQLRGLDHEIVVEGHTDSPPNRDERLAPSWELTAARAAKVAQFLVEQTRLDPDRITAAGYAHFRPRHALDSPDNAKNRGIEIVVLRGRGAQWLTDPSGDPAPPGAQAR